MLPTSPSSRASRIFRSALTPVIRMATAGISLPGILLLAVLTSPAHAQFFGDCQDFRRGDSNTDGNVDIGDPIRTLQHLFQGAELSCQRAADIEASGEIEITDAIRLLNYLFLGGEPPAPPGPEECGPGLDIEFLSCDSYPACSPAFQTRDLSDFQVFRYTQSPGLGFCPLGGTVYCAEIALDSTTGDYELTISFQDNRDGTDPFCDGPIGDLESICDFDCGPILRLPPRTLTAEEVTAMQEAFSQVSMTTEPDPICNCVVFDPCLIRNFTWDDTRIEDFPCSGSRMTDVEARRLTAFLDSLRPEG